MSSWQIKNSVLGGPKSDISSGKLDKLKTRLKWELIKKCIGLGNNKGVRIRTYIESNTVKDKKEVEFSYDDTKKRYGLLYTNDNILYYCKNTTEKENGVIDDAVYTLTRLIFATAMASGLFASVGTVGAWQLYKQRL